MLAAASGARAATARARSWAAASVAGGLRADASWGRSRAGLGRWFGATAAALADFDGVPPGVKKLLSEYESVPLERTRNFSIIAHVDHGKSTLADRMLELVGNIYKPGEAPGAAPPGSTKAAMAAAKAAESVANEQVLDSLKVERERGITVKAQTASLLYVPSGGDPDKPYLLNLIDTPGHVDFAYEVSRSLAACQGALLLVDCTQGVQAQTVANLSTARKSGLEIIPALTKIDLPNADPEPALEQIESVLRLPTDDVPWTSGKTGDGVTDALDAVVRRLGMPKGRPDAPTRALLFDSWYDEFRGVICVLQVVDGVLEKGDRVQTSHGDSQYVISELGLLTPGRHPVRRILAGQVGYVVTGMRDPREARVGDTVVVVQGAGATPAGEPPVGPLPGFEPSKPMVFASIFPVDTSDFDGLRVAVRLADEFDMPVIATAPMVPYRIELEAGHSMPAGAAGTEAATPDEDGLITVERPDDFPDPNIIRRTFEPMVKASVIAPSEAYSSIMSLMQTHRGRSDEISYLDDGRVLMKYIMPWQEVVTNFFDKLKSATAGYATFDYEPAGYEASNVVKIDMLLNGAPVDSLSFVAHRSSAEVQGRRVAQRLRAVIRRQQFEVVIQAAFGKKIFARERIPPYRKDVLSRSGKTVGGGDLTRKRKLLEKQKKGKARMRSVGNVQLSQEAFHAVLSRGE
ncbi:unnamed protein product [Symbiodinium sp. KB8]|nr:unnamed protein product [Symbiodinium sp. KB8]